MVNLTQQRVDLLTNSVKSLKRYFSNGNHVGRSPNSTHRVSISGPDAFKRHLEADIVVSGFELDKSPLHSEDLLPRLAFAFWWFHEIRIKGFADNVTHHDAELFDSGGIRLPDTLASGASRRQGGYHPGSCDADTHRDKPSVCHVPSVREIRTLGDESKSEQIGFST